MLAVTLSVLGLALVDSINPSVLGVTLFLLLKRHTGRSATVQVLTYLSAVAATYFTLGVLLMFGLTALSGQLGDLFRSPAAYAVTGGLGVGLFAWSWLDSSRDKKNPDRHRTRKPRLPITDRLPALFGLGLAVSVLEFSTALPFLAALGLMTNNGLPLTAWLPLLAIYVLIMVLPELVLLAVHRLLSDTKRAKLERLRDRLAANTRKTVQWIAAIVGFLLARNAVFYFAVFFGWYAPKS
ncbi:GAP family protein [Crossiella sp. CA198]|uniref:GAP family protein n=1 Tax=Crossiella sp. CA198 TaxID=3455607 RepID=UPI003F8D855F